MFHPYSTRARVSLLSVLLSVLLSLAFIVTSGSRFVQAETTAGLNRARSSQALHRIPTAGLYDSFYGRFYLRNSNNAGLADLAFDYGPRGDTAIAGDWDGNGTTTIGIYHEPTNKFFLRNDNSSGFGDIEFPYGPSNAGWLPVAGDWNGDGITTIGLYDPRTSTFYLKNTNEAGPADLTFPYGPVVEFAFHWKPVVGDWNGDGLDTVGLYDRVQGFFYLKDLNAAGPADLVFSYGPSQYYWKPLAGDWNGDGVETIGLYNGDAGCNGGEIPYDCGAPNFYLKNTNAAGPADLTFKYGPEPNGLYPLVGDWDGF